MITLSWAAEFVLQLICTGSCRYIYVCGSVCVCVEYIFDLVMQRRNLACFVLIILILSLCCFSVEQRNIVRNFKKRNWTFFFFNWFWGEGGSKAFPLT